MAAVVLVALVGWIVSSAGDQTEQASQSPSPAAEAPPPEPSPTISTVVVTYVVSGDTGPGSPYVKVSITYLDSSGSEVTRRISARDLPWSRNVEIENGGAVSLSVASSIFTSVSCSVDSLGLLNPIKGKETVDGNGWYCNVADRTLTWAAG